MRGKIKTMKLVETSGSALDMGRAQGALTIENWAKSVELLKSSKLPRGVEDLIAEYCPKQLVRMLGIARGVGVELDEVLAMGVSEIRATRVEYYFGACSTFALKGGLSPDKSPVIAQNFDFPEGFSELSITRISRPEKGLSSIDITLGPLSGSYGGVNEKGLAVTYNRGYAIDKPSSPMPITMLVQELLERFETTEDAINFVANAPRGLSALLMIADREGDVAAIELSPHYSGVRRPDGDVIYQTNHYHTPQMAAIDMPRKAYYSDKMPEALRGERVRESTDERYERLTDLFKDPQPMNSSDIKKVLGDHGKERTPSDNTICRHGSFYSTSPSVIIYTGLAGIEIAWGHPCESEFVNVAL